jgi:sugar lactone lactonase YvrE
MTRMTRPFFSRMTRAIRDSFLSFRICSLLCIAGILVSLMTVRPVLAQTIETVAGDGAGGYSGDRIPAVQAELHQPSGVALDPDGDLLIADAANEVIRKVNRKTGIIRTVAGGFACGDSGDGGPADEALLCSPDGLTVDRWGNLYIADTANHRIRRVDRRTRIITTVAGNGTIGFSGDGGPATSAQLADPNDVKFDAFDNLYIADTANSRVRPNKSFTPLVRGPATRRRQPGQRARTREDRHRSTATPTHLQPVEGHVSKVRVPSDA